MTEKEMFERSFKRPTNYFGLSERQQQEIDRKLGILDWQGNGLSVKDLILFQKHYFPEKDEKP